MASPSTQLFSSYHFSFQYNIQHFHSTLDLCFGHKILQNQKAKTFPNDIWRRVKGAQGIVNGVLECNSMQISMVYNAFLVWHTLSLPAAIK